MSSQVDVSLFAQEDSDMGPYFNKVHNAKEQSFSLWPLCYDPPLMYELGLEPNWHADPSHYTLLWQPETNTPLRITGPVICTNLFGHTAAEAFAGFPTNFDEFDSAPSSPSSPSLSIESVASSSCASDENGRRMLVVDLPDLIDDDVDEMSVQLTDRMLLDSPALPSPPFRPVLILDDDSLPLSPPPSQPTCNPSSTNDLFDGFSPSTTLVALSNASSTCAPSPSPVPFLASSSIFPARGSSASPAPEPRRSPRRASPSTTILKVPGPKDHFIDDVAKLPAAQESSYPPAVVPLTQIVLEDHPMENVARHSAATRGLKADKSFKDASSTKKPAKAVKRHPCTVPGCTESFTRPNDVQRHIKNAAIHRSERNVGPVCSKCGDELSRPDAARRHETKGACRKRTITKPSTYAMLPA
ncbi:hypothetical protein B0H12DRAFT_1129723 [Mycena haematopus]|nr:hypothetical protein B0H12DRAFT_1129723 [Mycena haematopus]